MDDCKLPDSTAQWSRACTSKGFKGNLDKTIGVETGRIALNGSHRETRLKNNLIGGVTVRGACKRYDQVEFNYSHYLDIEFNDVESVNKLVGDCCS